MGSQSCRAREMALGVKKLTEEVIWALDALERIEEEQREAALVNDREQEEADHSRAWAESKAKRVGEEIPSEEEMASWEEEAMLDELIEEWGRRGADEEASGRGSGYQRQGALRAHGLCGGCDGWKRRVPDVARRAGL